MHKIQNVSVRRPKVYKLTQSKYPPFAICTKSLVTLRYLRTSGSFGVENSTVPTQRQAHEISSRRCFDQVSALSKLSLTQLSWSANRWRERWCYKSRFSNRCFLSKMAWKRSIVALTFLSRIPTTSLVDFFLKSGSARGADKRSAKGLGAKVEAEGTGAGSG